MPAYRVVLVSPMHEGNVGAVARAMANFGVHELCMVDPCALGDEAYKRAKHAGHILDDAKVTDTFEDALKDCSFVVGTSGKVTEGEKHFIRIPETPRSFAEKARDHEGRIALLFGPEDLGLTQEQLERCDLLVHIPSSDEYPVLNLSHAVSIVLYEVFLNGRPLSRPTPASMEEKEMLFDFFHQLLEAIDYPEFRREKTEVMFRRMMGRAIPTKWEFYTIMGVFSDAVKAATGKKPRRG
ncbi:MAG TPA: RNA methyltransferase [Methanomassiliicoccaceae archaeon]|jgi:TrmH family RNA methyltransferase|nr:RNA methyltransferase [Euryarchaeota archaeon]HOK27514.1 RNA methyltransferase [Methanomassiliicoccaceae archaeon]HOQ25821.1 RNA methyltransferase [Methanomassiliicoccaceae archaeon]HPP45067.1 RNA methyltransferase [Methanomassiliicoccaceae archaeon]HQA20742.1 RNA methyltransferase [Methanomassiliicoccaceae archaeon]